MKDGIGAQQGLLRQEDVDALESMSRDGTTDCRAILEYLGRFIAHGVAEGRFTDRDAHEDLEVALWVGYACNNMCDYEHSYTACDWLSRVETKAKGCGVWYYRYANALMYCGKPGMALEYCERGIVEEPDYPWTWLTLGRLRSHFGDTRGALDAAKRGLALVPNDYEFLTLLADIETGATIEQMEMHYIDPGNEEEIRSSPDDPEHIAKKLAVEGIVVDRPGLAEVKRRLGVTGWSSDHPYCTYLMDRGGGSAMVTLMMNEAQISKRDPEQFALRFEELDRMDAEAREHLAARTDGRPLTMFGFSIAPDMGVKLSYSDAGTDDVHDVDFDSHMDLVDPMEGGPYAAIVLLADEGWDPQATVDTLRETWGMDLVEPEVSEDSIIAACDGHIVAVSLMRSPVPSREAEEAVAGNYMWPEGREQVARHTCHLVVALVNHGGDPVKCGMDFTRIVDACVRTSPALGVYENDTVYSPEFYMMEADLMRRKGTIPVLAMIWIGMYRTSNGICAYTNGMGSFSREDIEVLDADDESFNVMNFLYDVVYHSFATGTVYRDGDSFAYSADSPLRLTRSKGVSVDGYSLKIEYPGRRE